MPRSTLPVGLRTELRLGGRVEAQRSVATQARSGLNDLLGGSGDFDLNPAITEGTFAGLGATLRGGDAWRWSVTADGLSGGGHRPRAGSSATCAISSAPTAGCWCA